MNVFRTKQSPGEADLAGLFATLKSRLFFNRYALVQFFRQMSALVNAGFGTMRGIQTCIQQTTEPRLVKELEEISNRIKGGFSYSQAVAQSKDVFTDFHVSMLKAAEASGKLPEILESLAQYEEKEDKLRRQMKAATAYPIFVFLFSLFCIVLLMKFLSPLLTTVSGILKGELPLPTRILMRISSAVSNPVFYIALALFIIAIIYLYKYYVSTPTGKLTVDRLKFRIPLYGGLYKKVVIIQVCRIMNTLLESGVPAAMTMDLLGAVSDNFYFRERIMGEVSFRVQEGDSISSSFRDTEFFPVLMVSMISIGEQSGHLPDVMLDLSNMYEFDVDIAVANFYATLEPVLIFTMGLFTFFILMAAFLPIYQIVENISR